MIYFRLKVHSAQKNRLGIFKMMGKMGFFHNRYSQYQLQDQLKYVSEHLWSLEMIVLTQYCSQKIKKIVQCRPMSPVLGFRDFS